MADKLQIEPDAYFVGEDGTLNVSPADGLLANDFSSNGSLSVEAYTSPSHGTLEIFSTGSLEYIPDAGYTGTDSFSYTVTNGNTTETTTDTIEIYHAAPVAMPDVYTVQAGTSLNVAPGAGVLVNDLAYDAGTLTVESFTSPQHGTLEMFTSGSLEYVPDRGFVGQEVVNYTDTDGTEQASSQITIDVTDPAPVANADNYIMRAGQMLNVTAAAGLLANDVGYTDTLAVESFIAPNHGTLSVLTSGVLTYVPDAGFTGTDTFTYTDTDGVLQSTGTVTIRVADDAPVAQADYFVTHEGGTLDVSAASGLLANDFDPDGDSLRVISFTAPNHGTLSVTTAGNFDYIPDSTYIGTDVFSYTITDGVLDATATATIDVTGRLFPRNGLLIASPDAYVVGEHGTLDVSPADGLLANDYSSNGSLSVESYTAPSHGTLEIFSNGSLEYVPDAGYTGTDSFSYTITNGKITDTATDTIDIDHAAPVAVPDVYTVQAGTTLNVAPGSGVLVNDLVYDAGTLTVQSFTSPQHGTLEMFTSGSLEYVPDPGFVGQDVVNYTDTDGVQQASSQVTIDVTDPAPVANADNYVVRADQTLNVTAAAGLLANDVGYTGTLHVESFNAPNHGTLSVVTTGALTYVPDAGFTGTDSFTYSDFDGVLQSTGTVTVRVVHDAPVAQPDHYAIGMSGTLDVPAAQGLLANDYDPDGDALRVLSFIAPNHGTLSVTTAGNFDYRPDPGYAGSDSFNYTITDGVLQTSSSAIIDVVPCFCRGTRILTGHGEVAVEALRIGDLVATAGGVARPVKWIGRQHVAAARIAVGPHLRPVLVRNCALATGVPHRDLQVSAMHSLFIDDVFIPAAALVNGVTILRNDDLAQVDYFHIELEDHDTVFAEGAPAETYADDGSLLLFDNANEHNALYGATCPGGFSAPRLEEGFKLEAVRRRLAARAGLATVPAAPGALLGHVERFENGILYGWVMDKANPAAPVELEVLADGECVARVLANRYRIDLDRAGLAGGRGAFTVALPASVTSLAQVAVHRAVDGQPVPMPKVPVAV